MTETSGEIAGLLISVSVFWSVAGLLCGWLAVKVPDHLLEHDDPLTRIRAFEDDGRFYERFLRITRWKHRLPEAGDLFPGGRSKRRVGGRSREQLRTYLVETRRAEWVHWSQIALAPTFAITHSPLMGVLMTAIMGAVHLPFIATQRYNRARLARIAARRGMRGVRSSIEVAPSAPTSGYGC